MGRAPCCDKTNVKRGPWSPEEDATLRSYLESHGTGGNWIALPHKAGLRRCGKSCRLRWLNYLRPDIKHGCFTQQEDNIIYTLYNTIGSRWSVIASHLPGRTDNDVKNYWNTKLKKKLLLLLPHVEQQSTTTTTTTQAAATAPRSTPKPINPDPVVLLMPPARGPVPKVVKADQSLYSTPNLSSAAAGTGMEFIMSSSYDHVLIFDSESELILPPPPPPPSLSFPILMQSSTSSMIFLQPPPPPQSNTSTDDDDDDDDDHHLANTITSSCGQQLHEVVPLPPDQDGYSSSTTTTSSTSADHHHNWSSTAAINYPCSTTGATAGGQYGTGDHEYLFLQDDFVFGSYTSTHDHYFLAGHGGFGDLLVNAPLNMIYSSSSSSTKPQGIIYQNVTN